MNKSGIDEVSVRLHFNLRDFHIKVFDLSRQTIEMIQKLCSGKKNWNHENLRQSGLSEYDITRLRVRPSRSRYCLRQNLKKRESYDGEELDVQRRILKKAKRKKRVDVKQNLDIASIRRSLLKINIKYMCQKRLWAQI